MTIESLVSRNDYIGTGGVSVYAYGFKIIEDTDLLVTVQDGTTGVESTLTLGLDYSVSGEGEESGGDVTLSENLADGDLLTIRRVRPLLQSTDIETQGVSDPSVLEDTFDHLTMICQQQQDEIDRSLRLPETEADLYELPTATQRANKFLAFDADGEPIASDGGISDALPVSSYIETLLDDTDAAAARTTLDAVSQSELVAAKAEAIATSVLTGEIKMYSGSAAPSGYLLCDGTAVSRTTYATLYGVVGDRFGQGNGSTTFNLPDMRGRFARGWDNGVGRDPDKASRTAMATGGATGDNIGSIQGQATKRPATAFTTNDPGNHTHSYQLSGIGTASNNIPEKSDGNSTIYNGTTSGGGAHTHSITGGGDNETRPINVYLNFIIKT